MDKIKVIVGNKVGAMTFCVLYYACAERRMSYKMGPVSSFWCDICACKFMHAYIYQAIFRVGRGIGDYLKYSPAAAKILLLCWENVRKDLKKAMQSENVYHNEL